MRFHVISLPHTQVTKEYVACAYTQKVRKFCDMMDSFGHQVFLYAGEEADVSDSVELVTVVSKEKQMQWFGDHDFRSQFFNITWEPEDTHWRSMNRRSITEIQDRIEPSDFICIIAGNCQKEIADAFPENPVVEWGIGYSGVFAPFQVFESYSHMHWIYGQRHGQGSDDGRYYDAVIPNFFDPDEFDFSAEKDDYFLFLGRFISRKGPEIAIEVARRLDAKLILAGQGAVQDGNVIRAIDGEMSFTGDNLEHVGHVDVEQRAKLLAGAKAVFMPTTYLEPFGGVHIEAMLSGTPVIASDFGVFTETVFDGLNGFRFRTIGEATAAAKRVSELDPYYIHRYAKDNFGIERVGELFDDYFSQLYDLYSGGGFYSEWAGKHDRYRRLV